MAAAGRRTKGQGEEHTLPQEPEQARMSGNSTGPTISAELAAEVFEASSGALLSLMLQRVIEMPASYEPGANFPWDLIKQLNTATLDNVYAVSRDWESGRLNHQRTDTTQPLAAHRTSCGFTHCALIHCALCTTLHSLHSHQPQRYKTVPDVFVWQLSSSSCSTGRS